MGAITSFLQDKLQAQVAEQLIDETQFRVKQRSGLINDFYPLQMYDNVDFVAYLTEKLAPIASFVSQDGQLPTTSHGSFQRAVGQLSRIGLAKQFDGKVQEEMLKVMEEAQYKNSPIMTLNTTEGVVTGVNDSLANYVYDRIEGLITGCTDLVTALAWDVAQTGGINRVDPRTNITESISYLDQNASYTALHFPAALTNVGNTANPQSNVWTDLTNADGIGLLESWMLDYIDTNGFKPDLIVMPYRVQRYLQQQQSTIVRARQASGLAQVGSVSPAMLGEILMANGLPPLVSFDETYQAETTTPGTTQTRDSFVQNVRFLADNRVVFLKKDCGVRAMGQTIEMKNFKKADGKLSGEGSAIMVRVHERSKLPLLDELQALTAGLSLCLNPKLLAARVVI